MAQWVGQRPQKHPLIEAMLYHLKGMISVITISDGLNGSLPIRNSTSGLRQLRVELENAPSPAILSESEESSVVDQRLKDKIICGSEADERVVNGHDHANPPALFTKTS